MESSFDGCGKTRRLKTVKARGMLRRRLSFSPELLFAATALMLLDFGIWRSCDGFHLSPSFPLSVSLPNSASIALPASSVAHPALHTHARRTIARRSLERLPRRSSIHPPGLLTLVDQEDDLYKARFAGIERLYGPGSSERLRNSHVWVVGLGGVGSWVVEALARSGVGYLSIVDADDVCISNTNRQLCALSDTVGRTKASVMAQREREYQSVPSHLSKPNVIKRAPGTTGTEIVARNINPECEVAVIEQFATRETVLEMLDPTDEEAKAKQRPVDYVVDCIDGVDDKAALLTACVQLSLPVITCGGAGGLTDPTLLARTDLICSENDTLLFQVRKKMRQRYGFPQGQPNNAKGLPTWNIPAVHSAETIRSLSSSSSDNDKEQRDDAAEAASSFRACDVSFGTSSVVTGAFGLAAAGFVTQQLAQGSQCAPTVELRVKEHKKGHGLSRAPPMASLFD